MKIEKLVKPGKIGNLELKNHILMSGMGTNLAGEGGQSTDRQVNWYARRAKGGAGLVIVGTCFAATEIDPIRIVPCMLRADAYYYVAGLARLAEGIHENGAKAGIQLSPGGGAQAWGGPWVHGAKVEQVSPSGIPALRHQGTPRILAIDEIERIVQLCAEAAGNIKLAGFDVIELHALGGYLIAQFLSAYFNKRTDRYGGSLENRCCFLLDIITAIKKSVGTDFPILVKFSVDEYLPGGRGVEESQEVAKILESAGVSGFGISAGVHGAKIYTAPPYFYPRGVFLPMAEAIKKVVKIPVYVGGRMDDPELAEKAIADGKTDFISLGRGVIADPDWPNKVTRGEIEQIRPCLSCNECRRNVFLRQGVRCAINAFAGREGEIEVLRPAESKKKVLVVGAGPAGLEAARVAAIRGHKVTLCEKNDKVGGLLLLGGVHNEQITAYKDWIAARIKELPVEVKLKTEVTPALVEKMAPDVVILANGGTFVKPQVPGIDNNNVFSSSDLSKIMHGGTLNKGFLMRAMSPFAKHVVTPAMISTMLASNYPIKKNVATIGGQFPGCALALLLAHKGKKVTIIEESGQYGSDLPGDILVGVNLQVEEGNVKVLTSTKVKEITDEGVVVIDAKGNESLVEADTVLVALDLAPSDSTLPSQLKGKVKELYMIGDASSFRRIKMAVSEGYVTAYNL